MSDADSTSHNDDSKEKVQYHPSYCSPDADLVLASDQGKGTRFRVHSLILKLASEVFRDMLELKRDEDEACDEPIALAEGESLLKNILDEIYPNSITPHISHLPAQQFFDLAVAADKYNIQQILHAIRYGPDAFLNVGKNAFSPLLLYRIACRLGWEEERKSTSTKTLTLDFLADESIKQLNAMSAADAVALYTLRGNRKRKWFGLKVEGVWCAGEGCSKKYPKLGQNPGFLNILFEYWERIESGNQNIPRLLLADTFACARYKSVFEEKCGANQDHAVVASEIQQGLVICYGSLPTTVN